MATQGWYQTESTPEDFWRTTPAQALPDGVSDTTENIRRLAGAGLGGAATDPIPTIAGAAVPNVPLHLSNSVAGRGQVLFGSMPLSYYLTRPMSVTAQERVELGSIVGVGANGGYMLRISVSVSEGNNVLTKYYLVAVGWHNTAGVIQVVQPDRASTGLSNNDFELLMSTSNATTSLWLRRVSGANAGTYRVRIETHGDGAQTFTELSAAVVDAGVYPQFLGDRGQTTEWYRGGQSIIDARFDKTGNIYRPGSVSIGGLIVGGGTVPYNYTIAQVTGTLAAPIAAIATPIGTANDGTVQRWLRMGTIGPKFDMSVDWRIGSYFADQNARTRLDLVMGNGPTGTPETSVMTWLAHGSMGMGPNIPFERLDHRLNLEGPANAILSNSIAQRITGDVNPVRQLSGLAHNNNWTSFDGWWNGSWIASHTTRPYMIYKTAGRLVFYGMAALPAAAGDPWPLDAMASFRHAGDPATLAGGELFFENIVKNRRIVLLDSNPASDHQFFGFGLNAGTLRAQIPQSGHAYRWFRGDSATASTEIMTLLGTGRLGVNTPNPLTPLHTTEPGAATLAIRTMTNSAGSVREFVFTGATPNGVLTGSPGDKAYGVSPASEWIKATGVGNTGWALNFARAFYAATGISDASGNVTFTFPVGLFSVAPVAASAVQTAITDLTECRMTAISATAATFNVRRSPAITVALLGLTLLQVSQPAAGVTVHALFTVAG